MKGNITKRGRASWRLKIDLQPLPGGSRRLHFETIRGSRRDAQQRLAEMLAAVGRGTFVEPSQITVASHTRDRIEQWHSAGDIGNRTAEGYRKLLQHLVAPHIGDTALQRLGTVDIERWHRKLRAAGLSSRSIGHGHRLISKSLGDAVRLGMLMRNVAGREGQRAPKVTDAKAVRVLKADEIEDFVDRLRGHPLFPHAAIGLFCGLRSAELLALKWSSIQGTTLDVSAALEELDGQVPTLKRPKTRAGLRKVTMPSIVIEALQAHHLHVLELRMALGQGKLAPDALIFPASTGEPLRPSNLSAAWGRAVTALKLPRLRFHDLRHSHVSLLVASGLDVVLISKRIGHANPAITLKLYSHMFRSDDAAAADAINRALGASSVPKTGR
jgi:integrase